MKMVVTNHQTMKSTEMTWHDYEFKQEVTANDFSKNRLRRGR
ncbi:MAG: outer membrane lipoprotein-sorting protein [Kangiellaceae bacterium]|nr:outer membrane lipoprotein-sorting protein [Kangiellaceae bacterium]